LAEPIRCIMPLYTIRVQGHLGPSLAAWFDGLAATNLASGEAELVGLLADQAALHGVLLKIRDLGLPLLTVRCLQRQDPVCTHDVDA
jgi:hypothetical protein